MSSASQGISSPFSPRSVCEEALSIMRPAAEAKGLILEAEIPAYLPDPVQGDAEALRLTLIGLLGKVIGSAAEGNVRFQIGIEEDGPASLIFHCEIEGAGPDFALVETPIDSLDGIMGCDIRPGKGTRFWFTARLGALAASKAPRRPDGGTLVAEPLPVTGGRRILVCEDNVMNQKVIRLMLEHLGHASDITCNGEEALKAMEAAPYDVVFMDCQMPVMDGYEATRRIRASPRLRDTVVIAMTAHAMMGDREKCLAAGMDDYISKPISFESLGMLLENWTREIGGPAVP